MTDELMENLQKALYYIIILAGISTGIVTPLEVTL